MEKGSILDNSLLKRVESSFKKLISWLEINGQSGYDPYDLRGYPLYIYLLNSHSTIAPFLKRIIDYGGIFFPSLLRKILQIRKARNPKAVGLFAKGYIDLYKITHESKYLDLSKDSLGWLEKHVSKGYRGFCWGYPFDWQSLHFFPSGTPCSVVTAIIGEAFFSFYQIVPERKYLDICESICEFFLNDLNIDYINRDKMCFSYTPLDTAHIHNSNLLIADFLIRMGCFVKNNKYLRYGMNALNYTLNEQNEDGSFYYFGSKDDEKYKLPWETMTKIDHYHTGFILRSLYSIYQTTKDKILFSRIKNCYRHYLQNLFEERTIPKITPEHTYPVDIHSCAEAILCLSTLLSDFPEGKETLINTTLWTIREMQTKKGWFIYMIKKKMGLVWKIRIPYIRWGQAWMFRALSNYYSSSGKQCRI